MGNFRDCKRFHYRDRSGGYKRGFPCRIKRSLRGNAGECHCGSHGDCRSEEFGYWKSRGGRCFLIPVQSEERQASFLRQSTLYPRRCVGRVACYKGEAVELSLGRMSRADGYSEESNQEVSRRSCAGGGPRGGAPCRGAVGRRPQGRAFKEEASTERKRGTKANPFEKAQRFQKGRSGGSSRRKRTSQKSTKQEVQRRWHPGRIPREVEEELSRLEGKSHWDTWTCGGRLGRASRGILRRLCGARRFTLRAGRIDEWGFTEEVGVEGEETEEREGEGEGQEEERWPQQEVCGYEGIGGYKRWFLEGATVPACEASVSGEPQREEREEESPREGFDGVGSDPYQDFEGEGSQEEEGQGQEEEEGQEEEKEWQGLGPLIERWGDQRLQFELSKLSQGKLGQILGFRGRAGSSTTEEGQDSSWVYSDNAGGACQGATGPIVDGRYPGGRWIKSHPGGEADFLLPDFAQGEVGRCDASATRDASSLHLHGSSSSRPSFSSGGCLGGEIPFLASERAGRELGGSSPHGAVPIRRIIRSRGIHHLEDKKARKVGSQSSRLRPWELREKLWPWTRRKRQIRLLESRRCRSEREERKERERKRQGIKQGGLVERQPFKRRRVEGEAGDQTRPVNEQRVEGSLAEALKCEWLSSSSRFLEPATGIQAALVGCTSVRATGVVLCWLVLAGGFYTGAERELIRFFAAMGRDLTAKQPASRVKVTPGAFPIREGALCNVRVALCENSLEDILEDEVFIQTWSEDAWVYLCVFAVNSLAGYPAALGLGRWSRAGGEAVSAMRGGVRRRLTHDVQLVPDVKGMESELRSKHVGYSGEEISKCHPLSLSQILPALPPQTHGGSINALDWLGPRSREFLLHPEKCLLAEGTYTMPSLPGKVHIQPGERVKIAQELVSRRICRWIDLEEVHVVDGKKLLNGMFGVSKNTTLEDQRPILRVIMNLIPSNAVTHQLQGAVDKLPAITAWQSLVLDGEETLAMWQSDMSSAFYLFKIPEPWGKFLAFNIVVDGKTVGFDGCEKVALCSNVIPMGWASSVGLMQEMAEALVYSGGLRPRHQVRKGSPLPSWMSHTLRTAEEEDRMWWHVYLDNFCAGERLHPDNPRLQGQECHRLAELAWTKAGVLSSEKKKKVAVSMVEELGAEINGKDKSLGASSSRLLKTIHLTLLLLSKAYIKRKDLQILLGRWVFILQFRRPGMSVLNNVWALISGKLKLKGVTVLDCRRELFLLMYLTPLLHTNLGARVSPYITASDASNTGGACAIGRQLNCSGWDFFRAMNIQDQGSTSYPILLVSLFNGIGGCFRSYDVAGIPVQGRISVDWNKNANRIVSKTWPGTIIVLDIESVTMEMVQDWSLKFPTVEEVHLWAGFPCVDVSGVKYGRLNLEGPASKLFWHIPRVRKLLQDAFGPRVTIKQVVENVASMDEQVTREISKVLNSRPYRVDCVDSVSMRRPRYCWTDAVVDGSLNGIWCQDKSYWIELRAPSPYPPTESWIQPGYTWEGEESGAVFPTCMKSIKRVRPPPKPAGLEKCSYETVQRWIADSYRFPPYQYADRYLITRGQTWRLLSPVERELLLGYGIGHTRSCMSASCQKQSFEAYKDMRLSMLGDSFSIFSFVIFAVACSRRFTPSLHYSTLVQRMGIAPGFRSNLLSMAPVTRQLVYGSSQIVAPEDGVERLNRLLLRRTNHTGSDIRVITGHLTNPKAFPRQVVQSDWWTWQPVFQVRWKHAEHINALELEAILLSVKHCVSHLRLSMARLFHITDSYVCMSVIAKGRSSSRILTRKLRVLAAYLLAFDLQIVVGHVDSGDNPTDAASRA